MGECDGRVSVVAETASRLAARPAATRYAFHAGIGAILGQRAARARRAETAAGQAGSQQHLITSSSVQVKPPLRDTWVRSTTAPGTIGTGNICSCRVARNHSTWAGRPGLPVCYFSRTPCFRINHGVSPEPANSNAARAGLSRRAGQAPVWSLRRADRLWPPSFRDLIVEPARAAPATAGRRGPGLVGGHAARMQ